MNKKQREVHLRRIEELQNALTREHLVKKYGESWIMQLEEFHINYTNEDGDWLYHLNRANRDTFWENEKRIPKGLELKISLYWFQHFFPENKDSFSVEGFTGDFLDVPFNFENIDAIEIGEQSIDLPDSSYNWYELFILMNELMWRTGRVLDIGITSLEVEENKDGSKRLEVYLST